MARILEDRVLESTTSTGVGVITLAGAVTGFRRFNAVCAISDTVPYFIEALDSLGVPTGDYEYGIATYTAANQLTRTTVQGSSNAGAAVNFIAGTKNVGLSITKAELASQIAAGQTAAQSYTDTEVAKSRPNLTAKVSASGTSVDVTSIPTWVKRVTVLLSGVSTNGADNLLLQIGDAGGIETAAYAGSSASTADGAATSANNFTTGIGIRSGSAANVFHGSISLELLDAATNTWVARGVLGTSSTGATITTAGSKSLSATLDRIRLTTSSGVDTFDAGSVAVIYE